MTSRKNKNRARILIARKRKDDNNLKLSELEEIKLREDTLIKLDVILPEDMKKNALKELPKKVKKEKTEMPITVQTTEVVEVVPIEESK